MTWYERIAESRKPDLVVQVDGKVFLYRWWLIPRNPIFNIFLHKFTVSDEPVFHDHPWHNLSYVLEGDLVERFQDGGRLCEQGRFYFRRASTLHYLTMLDEQPVWTLFFTGPKLREWGFLTAAGWVPCFMYTRRPGVKEIKNYQREREKERWA